MPAAAERTEIRPQAGPQEAFLSCAADIAVYGGAAGGGKSFALTLEPLYHVGVPGFNAVVFRRTGPQLIGGGSVWDEQQGIYPLFGARSRESPKLEWRFPSGARIELTHLEHEKDIQNHQSKQYALIVFDELTQFTERQFWYMFSRNRSVCGVRPYVRAATNPDPDSFVRRLIDWWIGPDGYPVLQRSGVIRWFVRVEGEVVWGDKPEALRAAHPGTEPISFTFIAAKLADNPALTRKDPAYLSKLMSLPRVDRERLLGGNWNIRAAAGEVFRRSEFTIVKAVPGTISATVRGWDRAATEPSPENPEPAWSVGTKMARLTDGRHIVLHVERFRERAAEVERRIKAMAGQDGIGTTVALFQDPGSAGKGEAEQAVTKLSGYSVEVERATEDKVTFAGPYAAQAQVGNVLLLEGRWNEAFLAEHESFPDGHFKDQVDSAALAFNKLQVGTPGYA